MEKIIKIEFKLEIDAFKASQQLQQLDEQGDISIAETIIMSKSEDGRVSLKDIKGGEISFTLSGALAGSLIGILGGPLGVLWGAALGSMAGATGDLLAGESRADYLEKIANAIPLGKTVIVAHVEENWTVPIDSSMAAFEAKIVRLNVDEEIESYMRVQMDDLDQQIATAGKDKLEELRQKRDELQQRLEQKTAIQKKQYESWLDGVKAKLRDWKENVQEEIDEQRIARLEKQIARQEEKLAMLDAKGKGQIF